MKHVLNKELSSNDCLTQNVELCSHVIQHARQLPV